MLKCRSVYLLSFLVLACAHMAEPDPHAQMHNHFFEPPALASDALRHQMGSADANLDRVDWRRFKQARPALKGLKIALDPGHMGGPPWDERGGKFVTNSAGQRLSEGIMALQLALLLERELQALGADVLLTRRGLQPVTARDFKDFNENSAVYFHRLDLNARAEKIWAFHPDITLILHFDASLDASDPNLEHAKILCNNTKTYIPGAFAATTFKDDEDRSFAQIVWQNSTVWDDSLELSRAIIQRIHEDLDIPLLSDEEPHTELIEPGIFTRDLHLQRVLAGFVSSYLESLCYEDPIQFKTLAQNDHSMKIDGKAYPYSEQLVRLSRSIRDGVKIFVLKKGNLRNY